MGGGSYFEYGGSLFYNIVLIYYILIQWRSLQFFMIQLIQAATRSQSNTQRQQAEKTLIQMRENTPAQFFNDTAEVFKSPQVEGGIRQAAGTVLAASIVTKRKNTQYIWDLLDGNSKGAIKNSILSVMIDSDRNVRRAAANIVSAICFIELPRNEWEGIVEKICSNITNNNPIIREVSIITLGFICERLKDVNNFCFPVSTQEAILTGIVVGLKETDETLIKVALKALRDSIGSLSQLLDNSANRQYLLKQAGDMVRSQNYSILGLQILGQMVKYKYEFMGTIITQLFNLLLPIMTATDNEDACVAATEVWENLAEEYGNLSNQKKIENHIKGDIGIQIVTILLKNLCVISEGENDENQINQSTSKALETIFDNGSVQFKELVLNFVSNTIDQSDWRLRQASIKAFSLLLYGLPKKDSIALVQNSIQKFLSLLNDNSTIVKSATIQSLVIITEICGGCIMKRPLFLQYLELILSFLNKSQTFFKETCKILQNLCEADKEEKLDVFYNISPKLVQLLLNTCLNVQSQMIIINIGLSTAMSIIEAAQNQELSFKYISFVLENFHNLKSIGDKEKRDLLTSCFFTLAHTCLISIRKSTINLQILSNLYRLITEHFQSIGDVSYDGIYAASGLCHFFSSDTRFLDDFWKYILHALQKVQQPQFFKATLSCISDFAVSYRQLMQNKLESFVPNLMNLLKEPAFNRDLKLDILNCLSEIFLNCGPVAVNFLPQFMNVIMLCCQGAIAMVKIDFAYSQSLKQTIIDTLMCVLHGMNVDQGSVCKGIEPYIGNIFTFVQMSTQKSVRPTISYLSKSLTLLADTGNIYGDLVRGLGKKEFILQMMQILQRHNKNQEYSKILKYSRTNLK